MNDAEQIGRALKRLRKIEGISQAALADRLKVSQAYISKVEGGMENLTLETLNSFAKALRVKLSVKFTTRE